MADIFGGILQNRLISGMVNTVMQETASTYNYLNAHGMYTELRNWRWTDTAHVVQTYTGSTTAAASDDVSIARGGTLTGNDPTFSTATYPVKKVGRKVVISTDDYRMLQQSGNDLNEGMEAYRMNALRTIVDSWSIDLTSGTGAGNKVTGIQTAVEAAGSHTPAKGAITDLTGINDEQKISVDKGYTLKSIHVSPDLWAGVQSLAEAEQPIQRQISVNQPFVNGSAGYVYTNFVTYYGLVDLVMNRNLAAGTIMGIPHNLPYTYSFGGNPPTDKAFHLFGSPMIVHDWFNQSGTLNIESQMEMNYILFTLGAAGGFVWEGTTI